MFFTWCFPLRYVPSLWLWCYFKMAYININHIKISAKRVCLSFALIVDILSTENHCGYLGICMTCMYCATLMNVWWERVTWWFTEFSVCVYIYLSFFICAPLTFTLHSKPWIWMLALYPGEVGRNEEKFQIILSVFVSLKMWMNYVYCRCSVCSQSACSAMLDQAESAAVISS